MYRRGRSRDARRVSRRAPRTPLAPPRASPAHTISRAAPAALFPAAYAADGRRRLRSFGPFGPEAGRPTQCVRNSLLPLMAGNVCLINEQFDDIDERSCLPRIDIGDNIGIYFHMSADVPKRANAVNS